MSGVAEETKIAGAIRPGLAPFPAFLNFVGAVRNAVFAERDRWFLWLPVLLGTGIGIYFSLTIEPPLWLGLTLAAIAVSRVALERWHERRIAAALALAAVAVGFAAAEVETRLVAAPVLERPIRSMDHSTGQYYLNLHVEDRPGVLAEIAEAFGRNGVSIERVWQEGFGEEATLVFITHRAREGSFQGAVAELRELPSVRAVTSMLRVEGEE